MKLKVEEMTLIKSWVFFGTSLTLRPWVVIWRIKNKNKICLNLFFNSLLLSREGCSFPQVSHGTTQFAIQGVPFPGYISSLFLQSLLLATHPSTVLKRENVAIPVINGFIHWIAITSFNQFIIPPSFLDLDSFAVEINWIGFTSRLSWKKILSCLWGLWGLIGQLRFNFLFFQYGKKKKFEDVFIPLSLSTTDSYFLFHFPNSISFSV